MEQIGRWKLLKDGWKMEDVEDGWKIGEWRMVEGWKVEDGR